MKAGDKAYWFGNDVEVVEVIDRVKVRIRTMYDIELEVSKHALRPIE